MSEKYRVPFNPPAPAPQSENYAPFRWGEETAQTEASYTPQTVGRSPNLDPRAKGKFADDVRVARLEEDVRKLRQRDHIHDKRIALLESVVAAKSREGGKVGKGATRGDVTAGEVEVVARPFRAAVADAKPILSWSDNWDGEGSPGYRRETLDRAQEFLMAGALSLWRERGQTVPVPKVGAGPDGSIDLHWRENGRELLVNIPVDQEEAGSFYGDDAQTKIKGEVGEESNAAWLFRWLAR